MELKKSGKAAHGWLFVFPVLPAFTWPSDNFDGDEKYFS